MPVLRIGWGRDLPRLHKDTQRRALAGAGCDRVLIESDRLPSGRRVDWAWMMLNVRPGDVVVVLDGRVLLEPPKGKTSPRKRLFNGIHQIEDRGATIEVISGLLHSRDARTRDRLIARVLDDVARMRTSGGAGRPRNDIEPDERAWMIPIWTSLRLPTNDAARDKIRAEAVARESSRWQRISTQQLIKKLGPSGRVALNRKRLAAARKGVKK